jgi:hypothetical protein
MLPTESTVKQMNRRQALAVVAALAGTLHGQTVTGAQGRQTIVLALDMVEAVHVQYQGRRATITPAQLIEVLGGG